MIEGCWQPTDGRVVDGVFVPYSAEQAAVRSARPGPAFLWDSKNLSWVDPRTLDMLKDQHWLDIKEERSRREYAGFAWDGSTFDSDAISQSRIQGAVQLANIGPAAFSIDWTLADNTVRTLSGADMVAVGLALAQHINGLHVISRGLRAQIDAATSVAEVESVVWPTPPA